MPDFLGHLEHQEFQEAQDLLDLHLMWVLYQCPYSWIAMILIYLFDSCFFFIYL
jgi:hypothetical protein